MLSKQLTPNSILLTSDLGHHISLVLKRDDSFISMHNTEKVYKSLEEIAKEFNEKLMVKEEESNNTSDINVFGYPIKHDVAYEQLDGTETAKYPSYTVELGSKTRYAAGWWVLFSEGPLRLALSPKTSTLTNESKGPFMDKFTANVVLNNENKKSE